jgi:hypothetical protein
VYPQRLRVSVERKNKKEGDFPPKSTTSFKRLTVHCLKMDYFDIDEILAEEEVLKLLFLDVKILKESSCAN